MSITTMTSHPSYSLSAPHFTTQHHEDDRMAVSCQMAHLTYRGESLSMAVAKTGRRECVFSSSLAEQDKKWEEDESG